MSKTDDLLKVKVSLQDAGCEYVVAYYCGGGDSGAIEEYSYLGDDYEPHFEEGSLDNGTQTCEHINIDNCVPGLKEILEDLFYDKLNNIEDWWNNDGGYGYIALRLSDLSYIIDNNTYYTQTEYYGHEGSFKEELVD